MIINQINGIQKLSYLELGIGSGRNFNQVLCKSKTSVDANRHADFMSNTDTFFASIASRKKWDLIYIDANHDFPFALRDFNNAVKHCRQWVLIHDMIPPSEKYTASRFCSDSYCLLYLLWQSENVVYSLNDNFGLTFIEMKAQPIDEKGALNWYAPKNRVSYAQFRVELEAHKLYTEQEILKVING
jgi:hypothetical protein